MTLKKSALFSVLALTVGMQAQASMQVFAPLKQECYIGQDKADDAACGTLTQLSMTKYYQPYNGPWVCLSEVYDGDTFDNTECANATVQTGFSVISQVEYDDAHDTGSIEIRKIRRLKENVYQYVSSSQAFNGQTKSPAVTLNTLMQLTYDDSAEPSYPHYPSFSRY